MIQVKVGQVWQDNDPRFTGFTRQVKIVQIDGDKALCENVSTQRRTKIKLSRFKENSTGYKLVSE